MSAHHRGPGAPAPVRPVRMSRSAPRRRGRGGRHPVADHLDARPLPLHRPSGRDGNLRLRADQRHRPPGPVRSARSPQAGPSGRRRTLRTGDGRVESCRQRCGPSQVPLRSGQRPPHRIVEFGLRSLRSSVPAWRHRRHRPWSCPARAVAPVPRPVCIGPSDRIGRRGSGDRADTLHGGPLAHPVEQGTFNPKVARSRLARPTRSEAIFAPVTPSG